MACDTEMDELRKLGMGRPEELEELLHFIGMAVAIVLRKERVRITDLMTHVLLKPHLHHIDDQAVRQTSDAIRAFPCSRARAAGRHNQAFHSPREVLRQTERNPPTHGVT